MIDFLGNIYHTFCVDGSFLFFKMWTEVTDPMKYVYEDIAIATYLIVSLLYIPYRDKF